jgi:hypothetical protein
VVGSGKCACRQSARSATRSSTPKKEEQTEKQAEEIKNDARFVLHFLDQLAQGKPGEYIGYTKVRVAARLSGARMTRAVQSLVNDGMVEEGEAQVWRGTGN